MKKTNLKLLSQTKPSPGVELGNQNILKIEKPQTGNKKKWSLLGFLQKVFQPLPSAIMPVTGSGTVLVRTVSSSDAALGQKQQQTVTLEAKLDAPAEAHPGQEISVHVHLNCQFNGPGALSVKVGCHLLADGFQGGDRHHSVLLVPEERTQAHFPFQLVTDTPKGEVRRPILTAIIACGGQPCGMVSKGIFVHALDTPEALASPHRSASKDERPLNKFRTPRKSGRA